MGRTSPLHPPPPPQSSVLPHPLRAIEAVTRREAAVEEFDRERARPRGAARRSAAVVAKGDRQGRGPTVGQEGAHSRTLSNMTAQRRPFTAIVDDLVAASGVAEDGGSRLSAQQQFIRVWEQVVEPMGCNEDVARRNKFTTESCKLMLGPSHRIIEPRILIERVDLLASFYSIQRTVARAVVQASAAQPSPSTKYPTSEQRQWWLRERVSAWVTCVVHTTAARRSRHALGRSLGHRLPPARRLQ